MLRGKGWLAAAPAAITVGVLAPAAVAAPPTNDSFSNAAELPGPPSLVSGTVAEATRESGEPEHGGVRSPRTVWYRFRTGQDRLISLSTCRLARFDTVLAVYTGDQVSNLRQVTDSDDACSTQSRVTFRAAADRTYRIAVGSFDRLRAGQGAFRLRIEEVRAAENDDFDRARRIRVPGRFAGTTTNATRELGEPDSSFGDHTVWYRLFARRTETITLDTFDSSFDTVLTVYSGNRLGSLRRLATNDDAGGDDGLGSRVRLRVRRGSAYRIAVAGFESDSGDFVLNVSDGGAAAVGLQVDIRPRQDLDSVRESGLRSTVSCIERCRVRLQAVVSRTTARRLRLRSRVLGQRSGTIRGGRDPVSAPIALRRSARAALGRAAVRVRITLRATVLGTRSSDRVRTDSVTLSD